MGAVHPLVSLLFWLNRASIYTWLLAMVASSAVKYGSNFAHFSACTSSIALVAISLCWYCIAKRQEDLPRAREASDKHSLVAFLEEGFQLLCSQAEGLAMESTPSMRRSESDLARLRGNRREKKED